MSLYGFLRWLDYGVKGQKRGQHVKARDPEYLARLKGGKVSNVNYSTIGINNASMKNTKRKLNKLKKEIQENKGRMTKEQGNKLFNLNNKVLSQTAKQNAFSEKQNNRKKLLSQYRENVNKYNTNQKLLKAGITNEVVPKPVFPKELSEREARNKLRKLKKKQYLENSKKSTAIVPYKPSVSNKSKPGLLSRIGEGLKKHKGKAALAGLGLTALGAGLGYAKKKGAFDSNYEVLRIKYDIKRLQNRRHKDALTIKRLKKYNDLSVKQKAAIAIAAPFVGIPLAIALEKFVLTPLSHKMDIRDIYEGRWREKEFVSFVKSEYRRKSDKFWKWIAEPDIEPETYSEADYQKMKNLVMGAQTARDLSRLFPKNNFLKEAADAFEFRKKLKKQV